MTLQQTTDTIIKWLKSCTTPEQVNLTEQVFDRFVCYKFWNSGDTFQESVLSLQLAENNFKDALFHQKLVVTSIEVQTGAFAE